MQVLKGKCSDLSLLLVQSPSAQLISSHIYLSLNSNPFGSDIWQCPNLPLSCQIRLYITLRNNEKHVHKQSKKSKYTIAMLDQYLHDGELQGGSTFETKDKGEDFYDLKINGGYI